VIRLTVVDTRREFFEVEIDFEALQNHARSKDATIRWASAIELGQLGSEEAIALLWSLTTDLDENVRDAANLSLQQCNQQLVGRVLASKWSIPDSDLMRDIEYDVSKYVAWKIRPLEIPSQENQWAVDAALLNIIQIEGPLTGSRLLRLYGNAAYPSNPKKLPKSRIESAVRRLEKRELIDILNEKESASIESWTVFKAGAPEVVVREQGPRKLNEIPVTEVIARVRVEMGDSFDSAGKDEKFSSLQRVYGIRQADLHKVGEVLANEWASFLS
jgi:hypothetical protein